MNRKNPIAVLGLAVILVFSVNCTYAENIDPYEDGSQYAYGENVGWLNFDPNVPGDANDYGVKIDNEGNFSGYAWAENVGWINFNSADLYGYGVLTCKVNFIDLANFVDDWLKSGPSLPGDLSGNEEVDFVDYSIFADYWLTYCPDDWPLK